MFEKKPKERVFEVRVEECPDYMADGYSARIYNKADPFIGLISFYGHSQEEVEGLALAFIERVKQGKTHYSFEVH